MLATGTVIMALLAVLFFSLAAWKEGGVPYHSLSESARTFATTFPLILCAFLIEGALKTVIPTEWVQKWLAEEGGIRGVALGVIAGALTPGGPYTSFPIALVLVRAGAGLGTVVSYLTAWSLLSFTRYPMEAAFVGPKITVLRFLLTFWVPPFVGLLAHRFIAPFFPLSLR